MSANHLCRSIQMERLAEPPLLAARCNGYRHSAGIGRLIVALLLLGCPAALGERYFLLTGVDARRYPGAGRSVVPQPGPGVPGTFYDGDRLAGTSNIGPIVQYQGSGQPMFQPNELGSLSFLYRRGSVPLGPPGRLPFMGIEFLGGPLLDLDGDLGNGRRSFIPVPGRTPVRIPGSDSSVELRADFGAAQIELLNFDITGNNEGGPNLPPEIATILLTIAGTRPDGSQTGPINPGIDTRRGTLTPHIIAGVHRIQDLGFELWEDSIDPNSSTADTLGTFQFLGTLRGWLIERDPQTLRFPTLAGQGLGSTLWPRVDTSQVNRIFNTANGLQGGRATITDGVPGDVFSAPGNGGVALSDFGGDLGAYLDQVVTPRVPRRSRRFVYLESAGFGINNSNDPVYGDTISYDVVLIAAAEPCAGDVNGDGRVDQQDLGILLAAYLQSDAGDLDGDGDTDQADLGILLANWQRRCD